MKILLNIINIIRLRTINYRKDRADYRLINQLGKGYIKGIVPNGQYLFDLTPIQ
jgi:hypothetical protein